MARDVLHLKEEVEFLEGTEIELKSYDREDGWLVINPVTGGRYEIPNENVAGIAKAKKW